MSAISPLPWMLFLALCLGGCASQQSPPAGSSGVSLATDGPPLALVGEYGGMRLEGYMDRNCMAGYGSMAVRCIGQSQKGDLAVELPDLPVPPEEALKGQPAPPAEPVRPLALGSYPQQRQADEKPQPRAVASSPPVPGVPENPRSSAVSPQKGNSLVLGSYASDIPAPGPTPARAEAKPEPSMPLMPAADFVCKASVDHPPTEKGRIRGLLHCTGERQILFSLRNIGPDQGVGIGKETEDSGLMILFYHASLDEAWRRFPAVKEDIRAARERRN